MSKVLVVYYSSTGNTEQLAEAVAQGARNKGADVDLVSVDAFSGKASHYDAIAFGCSAMGAEQLEETMFEPMFASMEGELNGKKVGLFGSWGWGGGVWMQTWEDRVRSDGANLVEDGVICQNAPDADALAQATELGEMLA